MQNSALKRVRESSASSSSVRSIWLLGISSSLLLPLLVVDLGLIVQLLVSRGSQETPSDWVLGPWVSGKIVSWPFFGSNEICLAVLVATGALLSLLECGALILLFRGVQSTSLKTANKLRAAIYQQTFRLGPHELLDVARSRPEELFVDKAELVRLGLARWWRAIPRSVVALICLLLLAIGISPWLTLLAALLTVYTLHVYNGWRDEAASRSHEWREQAIVARTPLLQALSLAPLRTGYSLEVPSTQSFDQRLRPYEVLELRANSSEALLGPLLLLLALLSAAFLLFVIGLSDTVTVAGAVLLVAALISAYFPFQRLYRLREALEPAEQAAADILAFLDREPSVYEPAEAVALPRLAHEISLDSVTLANRQGVRLLDELSLKIPAGQFSVWLASDRQTPLALAGLFVRYYDPAAGRVLFDGHDLRQASLDSLRQQALLVPGDGLIIAGSIMENVRCGYNVLTPLQVTDALKRSRIYDYVQGLPEQLDTQLDTFDSRWTRQNAFRLGLARALARGPSCLLIQEPDLTWTESESKEHEEILHDICRKRNVIVIPTRIDTLRGAEMIYLFHHGKLQDAGRHADLLQRSELYRHLIYVRFNAFRDEVSA